MQSRTGRRGNHWIDTYQGSSPSLLLADPPHGLMADMKKAGDVPEGMAVSDCRMNK